MTRILISFLLLVCVACENGDPKKSDITSIVGEINKKCPLRLDSETRLNSLSLPGKRQILYHYTLPNAAVARLDTNRLKQDLRPGILSTIRVSPEMQKMREEQYTIVYQYRDAYRQPVTTIRIVPSDYRQL